MDSNSCSPSQAGAYPSDCEVREGYRRLAREKGEQDSRSDSWKAALPKAKEIQLLLLDVDGVLTDGSLIYSHEGHESKAFNTQDGFGLRLLQDAGLEVGIITARSSEALSRRSRDLKIGHLYQGAKNKLEASTFGFGYNQKTSDLLNFVKFYHQPTDNIDMVRKESLANALKVCIGYILNESEY